MRSVVSVETIDELVHRPVPPGGGDDFDAATRGVRRHRRRLAGLERRQRLDQMALLAHPVYEVSEFRSFVTRAVDDQRDMLGSHAFV
jgi:hypothetical protein